MSDRAAPGGIESVRRRNLATVLGLVHVHGPRSRAQLTHATGLNRSTVAALVAELSERGLVLEREPAPTDKVGRPSPLVTINPAVCAVAVNPEVDCLTVAVVGLDGQITARERIEADQPLTAEQTTAAVARIIDQWGTGPLAGAQVLGVGMAVPGLVRADEGVVVQAPHLHWHDVAIGDQIEAATGLPVAVGNDANLGALAEHLFGAGVGCDDLLYVNGGPSGIGAGVLVGGRVVTGAGGFAGEIGRIRLAIPESTGWRAATGMLEDEVNRVRLLQEVDVVAADESALAAAIAESDSSQLRAEQARQCELLASALANAANLLNPSLIIVGGFLATIAGDDLSQLRQALARQAVPAIAENLELREAALGQGRLLIGAAEVAFGRLLADPTSAL
ncbi:MAG: ROK family protein [Beutenbergiaceae bacterium]